MTSLDSSLFNSEIDPLLGNLATDAQEIAAQLLDTMFPHSPHKRLSLAPQMKARPRLCNKQISYKQDLFFRLISLVRLHEVSSQHCPAEDLQ
jgi:uncharacterized protein YktB (UPF0637 family)